MASTYKVLGQANPADTATASLYTVPADGQAVVSTISITNVSNANATYSVYIAVDGAADGVGNALALDVTALAKSTTALTLGVTLDAADEIKVKSGTASAITYQAFGLEIS